MEGPLLEQFIQRYEASYFKVNRRLNAMIREMMPEELTIDQFGILRFLQSQGQTTSSELADNFCVGKSSITAMINRLFDKQLIRRIPDMKDRRVMYLELTPEGAQLAEEMGRKLHELLATYIQHFDRQEAELFIRTFEKLASVLSSDS